MAVAEPSKALYLVEKSQLCVAPHFSSSLEFYHAACGQIWVVDRPRGCSRIWAGVFFGPTGILVPRTGHDAGPAEEDGGPRVRDYTVPRAADSWVSAAPSYRSVIRGVAAHVVRYCEVVQRVEGLRFHRAVGRLRRCVRAFLRDQRLWLPHPCRRAERALRGRTRPEGPAGAQRHSRCLTPLRRSHGPGRAARSPGHRRGFATSVAAPVEAIVSLMRRAAHRLPWRDPRGWRYRAQWLRRRSLRCDRRLPRAGS